jgi:hypothetical protein
MRNEARSATPEEVKAGRHKCWSPDCKHYAFLQDWMGWKWCIVHWIKHIFSYDRPMGSDKWYYIKTTEIF